MEDFQIFAVVVVLPPGFAASEEEAREALKATLDAHAPGAQVAACGIDGTDGHTWADAMLRCNAELGNLA